MKRRVLAVHFTQQCNLNCPMCYAKGGGSPKPRSFFLELVPHLPDLFEQVALGGGEPFLLPDFVGEFSKRCADHGIICNATTNGTLPENILRGSRHLAMVSVSFDRFKWPRLSEYLLLLRRLREAGLRVGSNVLVDSGLLNPPSKFARTVDLLFEEAERVFALCPKNWEFVPVLDHRRTYLELTKRHEHFYVDDLTYQILSNGSYRGWKTPCHFGRDVLSVHPDGTVTGCSFDREPLLRLERPEDIGKAADLAVRERFECPFFWGME